MVVQGPQHSGILLRNGHRQMQHGAYIVYVFGSLKS